MNGSFHDLKVAFGQYVGRFYAGLYPDTPALKEFTERGLVKSIVWAPGRMVDEVEKQLQAYQKNDNRKPGDPPQPGRNALFPVMVLAMSKDYVPTGGDFGGRQVHRQLVALEARDGASVYGYRQAMGDIRVQVVIMAAETGSAQSLAAQFSLFVGQVPNRRFRVLSKWGQYTLDMPCMLETPDIMFSKIDPENQGMTILAADLTLKAVLPYLDAPAPGEDNDGTANDPPGYPTVERFDCLNEVTRDIRVVEIEVP